MFFFFFSPHTAKKEGWLNIMDRERFKKRIYIKDVIYNKTTDDGEINKYINLYTCQTRRERYKTWSNDEDVDDALCIACGREKVDRCMKDNNKILIFSHTFTFHYMIRFHFDSLIVLPSEYFSNGTLCDVSNFKRTYVIRLYDLIKSTSYILIWYII